MKKYISDLNNIKSSYIWGKVPMLLAFFSLLTSASLAQENLLAPIIKVGDLNGDVGAAFLVGEENGTLYFITAWHVIEPYTSQVPLRFRGGIQRGGRTYRQNESLDIAVITCPLPSGFSLPPSFGLATGVLKVQDRVITIGHPYDNDWDVNYRASVKETEIDFDPRYFSLNPEGIRPGSSGGPVLNTDRELLGMMLSYSDIKARVISMEILMRLVRETWKVPTNQMLGIPAEQTTATIDNDQMAYSLSLQEANYAFANGYWENAKRAFAKADAITPSQELKDKIAACDREIDTDQRYQTFLKQGLAATDLTEAIELYRKAQKERNTPQVRDMISQAEKRLAAYGEVKTNRPSSSGNSLSSYSDPLAGEMILVEGGTFQMGAEDGDDDEKPVHKVTIPDFYLGKYEVTQGQWEAIMGENPSEFQEGKKYPVERISWNDAQEFIEKLNQKSPYTYRLPTEAEWEYAAGGGENNRTKFPGTNHEDQLYRYGNFCDQNCEYNFKTVEQNDHYKKTAPVGSYLPNSLGLYDMAGNVYEWCADWYHDSYENAPSDGSVWIKPIGKKRVIRGGGWSNIPVILRDSYRNKYSPGFSSHVFGFRLARTP